MSWLIVRKESYCVRFPISSTQVILFDDTSKIRRLTKEERPSIFEIPLWLKYSSSRATHSYNKRTERKTSITNYATERPDRFKQLFYSLTEEISQHPEGRTSNPFIEVKRLLCKLIFLMHFNPHKFTDFIRFLPSHNSCKFVKFWIFSKTCITNATL